MQTLFHIHTKKTRGFSLIELLVSVALFAVVMTVSVSTLLALVDANKKAQTLKAVINNLNFGLDSMTRTLRTGRSFYCANGLTTLSVTPQDCASGASGVSFLDDHGRQVGYRHNTTDKSIERRIVTTSPSSDSGWVRLTAPDVAVNDMLFYVTATSPLDGLQPIITISIRGFVGNNNATESSFNVQTTVTQRVLDQ